MPIRSLFRGLAAAVFAQTLTAVAAAQGQVTFNAGDNLQAIVSTSPAGTTFVLNPGVYRMQSVQPRNGDSFVGMPGAVLNGAMTVSGFYFDGRVWGAYTGYMTPGQQGGICDAQHPMCAYPEDLFFDGVPKTRVASLAAVGPGKWYLAYDWGSVFAGDNPAGHQVEMSVSSYAFSSSADRVSIRGLTIEKYAMPAQRGAIRGGTNWTVYGNEIRLNHGDGIDLGSGSQASKNYIHDNGQKGIGIGHAQNISILDNEIARNNYAGFDCAWECGGIKASAVDGYVVVGNYIHDNVGPGIWTDIDSINVLYYGNRITNNLSNGVAHEISYKATIADNVLCGNAGAQIALSTSQDAQVFGNRLYSTQAHAIDLWQQARGTGAFGPYLLTNDYIHDNQIFNSSVVYYWDSPGQPTGNRWDFNQYHTPQWWIWRDNSGYFHQFSQWQSTWGFDMHGTVDTAWQSCPS